MSGVPISVSAPDVPGIEEDEDLSFLDDVPVPAEPLSDGEWKDIDEWAEDDDNLGVRSAGGSYESLARAATAGDSLRPSRFAGSSAPTAAPTICPTAGTDLSSQEATQTATSAAMPVEPSDINVDPPSPQPHDIVDPANGDVPGTAAGITQSAWAVPDDRGHEEQGGEDTGGEVAPDSTEGHASEAAIAVEASEEREDATPEVAPAAGGWGWGGGTSSSWGLGALGKLKDAAAGKCGGRSCT